MDGGITETLIFPVGDRSDGSKRSRPDPHRIIELVSDASKTVEESGTKDESLKVGYILGHTNDATGDCASVFEVKVIEEQFTGLSKNLGERHDAQASDMETAGQPVAQP